MRILDAGRNWRKYSIFKEINGQFQYFMRITSTYFDILIYYIRPKVTKNKTICRKLTSIQKILAVTFRFLVTGESITNLQFLYSVFVSANQRYFFV